MQLTEVVQYDTSEVEFKRVNPKLEEMKSKSKHEELVKELLSKVADK